MQSHARVVVIGGGMMGTGLLYHLAEQGWSDCLLIEKGELTSGSTWHAAGQCPSFIADYSMAKIHHYGNTLYPKLEQLTGQNVSWHGCGGIRFALNEAELEWFRHIEGISKLIGFEMHILGPHEIRQHNPHVDISGVVAGALTIGDGHVDPAGCCNALAKGARKFGAKIERFTRVEDIQAAANGEWDVVTDKGTVRCEHVVNAAGCYARRISQMVGTDVPISNREHHYLVTEPIREFIDSDIEMPVMRDPSASAYFRQEQNSALIGLYETHTGVEAWADRGGSPDWESDSELFEPDMDRILPHVEKVLQRMPIWADAGIRRIVNGAIPHTPDANPLLGPAMGVRNFWQCCGSSIGIAQGAGCGKYLAQWMIDGDAEINMAGLDPRRFCGINDDDWVRAKSLQDYTHMYKLHLPGEERDAGRGVRKSTLYEKLKDKGAVFTEAASWERPKWFSLDGRAEEAGFGRTNVHDVVAAECMAVRDRVGVTDLSSFAKFDVTGADAEAFLNRITANRLARKPGGITLTHWLGDNGMIHGEATISRLAEGHYYVLSGAAAQHRDLDHLRQPIRPREDVRVEDITDDWGTLVVAGPRSRDTLAKITAVDLTSDNFRWLSAQVIGIAGIELRALRVNYVGELGWELHVAMPHMPALYDAVWAAGEEFAIADAGTYAVNSLRLEKAYKGWGAEMTNEITMIEADMERFVKYDKDDFIGKAATLKRKQERVSMRLVYCRLDARDHDAHGGEAVLRDGKVIGITTSGGWGHYTKTSLAFAYVAPEFSAPGSEFDIEILGSAIKAVVLDEPVHDPHNARLRA